MLLEGLAVDSKLVSSSTAPFSKGMATKPYFPFWVGNGARAPLLPSQILVTLREMQEREKALRLQKEQLQRELEEKKKKVGCWEYGLPVGSSLSSEARQSGSLG